MAQPSGSNAGTFIYGDNPVRQGPGSPNIRMEYWPVAASTTINKGDFVSASSGAIAQSIALPGSNNSLSASGGNLPTLGIANMYILTDSNQNFAQPGGFTQSPGMCEVFILDDTVEFALQLWNSTLADTPITNLTLGTAYEYGRFRGANSSTWKYVITTTTTNGEMKYIEAWNTNDFPSSSNYGWGWFRPILSSTVRQG